MEIKCPSCNKANSDAAQCIRCGCELEGLIAITLAARRETAIGAECLKEGKPAQALNHAARSWMLKKSPEAAKLGFLAGVGEKKFEEALIWRERARIILPS